MRKRWILHSSLREEGRKKGECEKLAREDFGTRVRRAGVADLEFRTSGASGANLDGVLARDCQLQTGLWKLLLLHSSAGL